MVNNPLIDPLINPLQKGDSGSLGGVLWTPDQLSDLAAWYDAADASTITESGGNVSQWDDKSGNNYHATQGTGGIQPETGVHTQNGRNVLLFDGDDYFTLPSGLHGIPNGNNVQYAVALSDAAAAQYRVVNFNNAGTIGGIRYKNTSGLIEYSNGGFGGVTSSGHTDTQFNILSGWRNAATNAVSINGENAYTNTTGANATATKANIGTFNDGTADTLSGQVAEVIICDAWLSLADRQKIDGYLAHKWGLASLLPSGHPYKSSAPVL